MEEDRMRYPLGRLVPAANPTTEDLERWIMDIGGIAATLRSEVEKLTMAQLLTPYRPGGWTVLQVVHHLADTDLNAYFRFKRALTEDEPQASTFREDAFAELADYRVTPAEVSLAMLGALHRRFLDLLQDLLQTPAQFRRTFTSPKHGVMTLAQAVERFAWHGRHHIAQITGLKSRMGWN
ncbi:putative metal-dependent hydrolase [Paenibacillus rhizovicinus]|uniref:Putative metal-dependent hydrolase n=1 Tax=Paenibacillus rhizovicinus TaxID=2704463 RepID=A0A6C0P6T3_9BACL|nr:putative metal-dependent hydrolase [Paenibacillus rhizovicinus]QHW34056.1 putative metal-dependent hydrolase [Paenibacillus rhizovicinus]